MSFGIKGNVLAWFTSYVSGHFQSITISGNMSNPRPLLYGVPQDSVLGPVLFTLYSQPLSVVISKYDCSFHKHADDTQISQSRAHGNIGFIYNHIRSEVYMCYLTLDGQ